VTALAGAAVLLVAIVARLPSPLALAHPPQTPYDRCKRHLVPAFTLLTEASRVLPAGAAVTVVSEPPNAALDSDTHRMGVALLPGRLVIPAALFGVARPDLAQQADYVVVVGGTPSKPPGERLLTRPDGTVWRRRPS
jgi:hypothetical protein